MGFSANWRIFITCFISFFILSRKTLAQKGFLSFHCCAVSNFSDPVTGITWTTDDGLLPNIGICRNVSLPVSNDTSYKRVRIFGMSGGNKWCYNLTTISSEVYLIRATFLHGSSLQASLGMIFNISLGPTIITQVNASTDFLEVETLFRASGDYVNFCLIKGNGIPFLSKLELRPLNSSVHYLDLNSSVILRLLKRVDVGNTNTGFRFPVDQFDRIWSKDESSVGMAFTSSNASVFSVGSSVPTQVLQTAVTNSSELQFSINSLDTGDGIYLVCLYFLELNSSIKSGQRVFDIYANGERRYEKFDILENGTNYREVLFQVYANGLINISLFSVSDELGPMCNAYEVYRMQDRVPGTVQLDVDVLVQMRKQFLDNNINNSIFGQWSGDPCLPLSPDGQPVPWKGLHCDSRRKGFFITKLDLSSTGLQGPVPTVIRWLSELQELNLSRNHLIGTMIEFPVSSMITSINIQDNNLVGAIPESFAALPHLIALSFGCNSQLNNTLPAGLLNRANFTSDFGICGGQNDARMQPQRSTIFIGSVAGGSLLLSVAVVAIFTFFYKRRLHPDRAQMSKNAVFSLPIVDEEELKPIKILTFSLQFIETATSKYKTMIGEGGFGAVYRGTLTNGQEVAVKVRSATSAQGIREFENELNLLSAIQHENLVPLLGYCCENDQQILVYPFMSNGSLQDRLYGETSKVRKTLDWQIRLSIALGAARGLMYLHTFSGRCVIHRDVKSSNILLDHSMCAKVADFGFSKYAPQEGDSGASLEVRGTAGYLDPEYYSTQQLSVKSDVFSFGVVLLEIICGREPLNIHRPRNEWSLVEWAKPFIRESRIEEVVDSSIKGGYTAEAMWRVVEVALACIEPFSVYRPCMADIVRELEDALIIENNASEYMRSIESFGGSCRFSSVDKKILATPTDPSPIYLKAMAPPLPR